LLPLYLGERVRKVLKDSRKLGKGYRVCVLNVNLGKKYTSLLYNVRKGEF